MTTVAVTPQQSPLRVGLQAARHNLGPALILWVIAVAILVSYYWWPPAHAALEHVARLKVRFGYLFSAVSTVIFALLIPTLLQRLTTFRPVLRRRDWIILLIFWIERGVEVDAFFRLQAWIFGDQATPGVIAAKLVVDMLLYAGLWAIPSMIIVYRLKDGRGFPHPLGRWYLREALPTIIANWTVWVPALAVIYSLPLALQLPMQNLVLCLWVLIFTFLVAHHRPAPPTTPPPPRMKSMHRRRDEAAAGAESGCRAGGAQNHRLG